MSDGLFHFLFLAILQSIDMVISLYENNFPVRFGVILYSSNFIEKSEINRVSRHAEDNGGQTEDLSSLVLSLFYL